ncbi:MAG: hypothetical protein GY730_07080 [bacterium]|nr:hypothetical protein [bacterium]
MTINKKRRNAEKKDNYDTKEDQKNADTDDTNARHDEVHRNNLGIKVANSNNNTYQAGNDVVKALINNTIDTDMNDNTLNMNNKYLNSFINNQITANYTGSGNMCDLI